MGSKKKKKPFFVVNVASSKSFMCYFSIFIHILLSHHIRQVLAFSVSVVFHFLQLILGVLPGSCLLQNALHQNTLAPYGIPVGILLNLHLV